MKSWKTSLCTILLTLGRHVTKVHSLLEQRKVHILSVFLVQNNHPVLCKINISMLLCAKPCKYVQSQSRCLLLSGKHEGAPPHFWQPDSLTKLLHSLGTWWLAPATQKLRPCISQLAAAERKAGNRQICFNQAFGQISQNSVRCENKGHGREREWFWFLTLFKLRTYSIVFLLLWLWHYGIGSHKYHECTQRLKACLVCHGF